jgi:hypothetical protein
MGIKPKSKKLGSQHKNTKAQWKQNYTYNFWTYEKEGNLKPLKQWVSRRNVKLGSLSKVVGFETLKLPTNFEVGEW